ncbi:hypothetical protein, partial [Tamilnaduibacter salinus]|uniref:hypothetical protein n=1 Tax=Tamilnaduibacter salinus TaxID=1484056 RepID=UPI001B806C93
DIGENGDYSLSITEWSGPTAITLEGEYFNETTGTFSGQPRTLEALTNVESGAPLSVNVNLFTHFVAARSRSLMSGGAASRMHWRRRTLTFRLRWICSLIQRI